MMSVIANLVTTAVIRRHNDPAELWAEDPSAQGIVPEARITSGRLFFKLTTHTLCHHIWDRGERQ